jgi:8-oxo-dGTP diphosphatase
MEARGNQKFTLGFIFNPELTKVLLVHKEKPEWQKGKINGIGGKYEDGETAEQCISRETFEESTLRIPSNEWTYVGTVHQERGDFGVLAATYAGPPQDAVKNDYEEIEWFKVGKLPANVIPNLQWLVPLALYKLQNNFESFEVNY